MSKKITRVGYFYEVFLRKYKDKDAIINVNIFERVLTYISALDNPEKTYSVHSTNIILAKIKRTNEGSFVSYRLKFGKFSTDKRYDIRNKETGSLRHSDKSENEGDEENTHVVLYFPKNDRNEISGTNMFLLKETFNRSLLIDDIMSYFKHMSSQLNRAQNNSRYVVESRPVLSEDFLDVLSSQNNITQASIGIPRKYLGSDFCNFGREDDIKTVDFNITLELKPAEKNNLKNFVFNLFSNSGNSDNKDLKSIEIKGDEEQKFLAKIIDGQAILEQKTTKRSMLTSISVLIRTGAIDSDELFDCMEQCLNEYLDNEN